MDGSVPAFLLVTGRCADLSAQRLEAVPPSKTTKGVRLWCPAESRQAAPELVKKAEASFACINEIAGVVEWPSSLVVNFRDSP